MQPTLLAQVARNAGSGHRGFVGSRQVSAVYALVAAIPTQPLLLLHRAWREPGDVGPAPAWPASMAWRPGDAVHGATQDLSRARWLRARRLRRHAWSVRRALVLAARSSGRARGGGLQPCTLRAQAPTRAPRGASGVAEPPNAHHEDFAVNLCTMGSASAAFLDRSDPPRAKTPYGTSPALRFNSASDASDATPAVPARPG